MLQVGERITILENALPVLEKKVSLLLDRTTLASPENLRALVRDEIAAFIAEEKAKHSLPGEFEKNDCCHRFSAEENHAPGCENRPDYVSTASAESASEPAPLSQEVGEAVERIVDQNTAPDVNHSEEK